MVDWPPCCHTKMPPQEAYISRERLQALELGGPGGSFCFSERAGEVSMFVWSSTRNILNIPEHILCSILFPFLYADSCPTKKMMVYDPWPNLLWKVGLKFWITAPYLSLFAGYTSMFDCHTRYPHMYTYVTYVSISQSGWFYFPFRFYLQDWCFSYPILVCEESQFLLVISWLYHCCRTWYTQLSQLIPALFGHVSPIAMGH